ncbi:MAG: hypothetical protein V4671_22915 [Armatimonadota bacterium]
MTQERTVRELGGEIWGEIELARRDAEREGKKTFTVFDWTTPNLIAELVMGVLARHTGKRITNDADIPVDPLPVNQDIASR